MSFAADDTLNVKYRELCTGIGHLFICFSRLEGALSAILRLHLANNTSLDKHGSVALSSAIYGSMRYKTSRDTIKRLLKLQNTDDAASNFIDAIFSHVGQIEDFRNKIAHDTVVPVHQDHLTTEGFWQVSDQSTTRDIRNPKIYIFNTELVVAACQDLIAAAGLLTQPEGSSVLFHGIEPKKLTWRYNQSKLKLVNLEKLRTPR